RPARPVATRMSVVSTPSPARAVSPLSNLLAVEHAAVYACGAAGGGLGGARAARGPGRGPAPAARQARAPPPGTRARPPTAAAGGDPPAALPAYQLPLDPTGTIASLRLLALVEDRTAAAARDAVGVVSVRDDRALVAAALAGAAVRAQRARLAAGTAPPQASV